MTDQEIKEAELKLRAYQAATAACSQSHRHSLGMAGAIGGGLTGPAVGEIKTEAERLWGWMIEKPPQPEQQRRHYDPARDPFGDGAHLGKRW